MPSIEAGTNIVTQNSNKAMYAEVYSQAVSDAIKDIDRENLSQEERTKRCNAILFAARQDKLKQRSLQRSFGLGYIERADYQRVMRILHTVSKGNPIGEKDMAWLGRDGYEYWTDELSRVRTHNQNKTIAASAIAERNISGHPLPTGDALHR